MKKKVTTKKIAKKAKEVKKKPETTLKTVTKKKVPKKAKTKEKKTTAKKIVAKIEKKPEKVIKKIIAEIEKKPEKVVKKVVAKIKKKLKKVAKKAEVKKKEVKVKFEKKPKKVAKKVVAKIKKKILLKPEKKVEIKKITKKPKKRVEVKKKVKAKIKEKPKKKVEAKIKEKPKKVVKKVEAKVELKKPVIEEKYPPTPWETLPAEYGEDSIALMTVDPNKLFTYWEVREDTLAMHEGNLNIRVYDITGVEFDGTNANSYFDTTVSERIGSRYIDVSPEKEFITDIGIINIEGIFITIARSNTVLTPRITISEEAVLPQKLYETGLRVGY